VGDRDAEAAAEGLQAKPSPNVRPTRPLGALLPVACAPTSNPIPPVVLAGDAGEFALAVLAAPGPPQLAILGHLEPNDK
jgi:hypothetical protein